MPSVTDRLDELRKDISRDPTPAPADASSAARRRRARPPRARGRAIATGIALAIVRLAGVAAIPFLAYVRTAVFFYHRSAPGWLALLLAALVTLGIVSGYAAWFARRFRGRARARRVIRRVALPTAAAWCLYSALYLARVNAKTDAVHRYYASVHPILRVALSTIILVDPDLVVTDAGRVAADYARMGLARNDRTLHYLQRDGWVHAVDLRTRDRGVLANGCTQLYFRTMGFSTLRHVGTADHLHVQLRMRDE